tara:strand:- start:272 stop:439 length:168 start_codon:yes stop_codon:yes gene_type:complete
VWWINPDNKRRAYLSDQFFYQGTWFCVSAFLAFGIFIDHAVRLYLSKIKIGARRF